MRLAEIIAEEIFRTIERERHVTKDDLIQKIEQCLSERKSHPDDLVEMPIIVRVKRASTDSGPLAFVVTAEGKVYQCW